MSEANPIEGNNPVTTPGEVKPPSNIEGVSKAPAQNPTGIESQDKQPEVAAPPTTPEITPETTNNNAEPVNPALVENDVPKPENPVATPIDPTTQEEISQQVMSGAKKIETLWNKDNSPYAMNVELMNYLKEGEPSTSE